MKLVLNYSTYVLDYLKQCVVHREVVYGVVCILVCV